MRTKFLTVASVCMAGSALVLALYLRQELHVKLIASQRDRVRAEEAQRELSECKEKIVTLIQANEKSARDVQDLSRQLQSLAKSA